MSAPEDSSLEAGLTWIDKSKQLGSLAATITTALGGLVAFIFGGAIAIGDAGVNLITDLIGAFSTGGADMIGAFLSSPASFLQASWDSASASLQTGGWAALGPFLPWIAAISVIGFIWMITSYLDRQDSDVPGLGLDLPFIGNESEREGIDWPIIGNNDEGEGE